MFTPKKTLTFLRALKRNNRREWFVPRKDDYERHVRAPIMALIERLGAAINVTSPRRTAASKGKVLMAPILQPR
jgi:uncharacterized protein (DUF2461 family)